MLLCAYVHWSGASDKQNGVPFSTYPWSMWSEILYFKFQKINWCRSSFNTFKFGAADYHVLYLMFLLLTTKCSLCMLHGCAVCWMCIAKSHAFRGFDCFLCLPIVYDLSPLDMLIFLFACWEPAACGGILPKRTCADFWFVGLCKFGSFPSLPLFCQFWSNPPDFVVTIVILVIAGKISRSVFSPWRLVISRRSLS